MFDTLIRDSQTFLTQLNDNNSRDWFVANKARYDATLRDPAARLLEEMAPQLAQLTGYPVTTKLFRPQRDVRFSKDKTPYKTHLHMMWTLQTSARQNPAFFFGIDLSGVTVATGLMGFDKAVLSDWREMVDLDGDHIAAQIKQVTDKDYRLWEPELKRVPPSYAKDHPHGDLLRQKRLVAAGSPDLSGDLSAQLLAALSDLWPLSDMLIGVAEPSAL